jgi:hypothetical protein
VGVGDAEISRWRLDCIIKKSYDENFSGELNKKD